MHNPRESKICILIIMLVAVSFAGIYGWNKDNIHEVIKDEVYRSAQLSPDKLEKFIKKQGIRTIINLRGEWPKHQWYQAERAVVASQHLAYYSIALSTRKLPHHFALQQLVQALQTAPRPILIHCRRGADRTGFGSAVAHLLAAQPLSAAKSELSIWYGSVRYDSLGRLMIPLYDDWLRQHHWSSSAEHFLRWVVQYHKPQAKRLLGKLNWMMRRAHA